MVPVSLSSAQKVTLRIAPKDANEVSREVDSKEWILESGDGVLTPATDGLSAEFVPNDAEVDGSAIVRAKADADLTDAGVVDLEDTFEITITAVVPQAVTLGLTADAPTPKA